MKKKTERESKKKKKKKNHAHWIREHDAEGVLRRKYERILAVRAKQRLDDRDLGRCEVRRLRVPDDPVEPRVNFPLHSRIEAAHFF
jgi:ribosomal protein L13